MRPLTYSLALIAALAPCFVLAEKSPGLPEAFYGTAAAGAGTRIEAYIGGTVVASTTVAADSTYGHIPHPFFILDADNNRAGAAISFVLGSSTALAHAVFENGAVTPLRLLLTPDPAATTTPEAVATSTQQDVATSTATTNKDSANTGGATSAPSGTSSVITGPPTSQVTSPSVYSPAQTPALDQPHPLVPPSSDTPAHSTPASAAQDSEPPAVHQERAPGTAALVGAGAMELASAPGELAASVAAAASLAGAAPIGALSILAGFFLAGMLFAYGLTRRLDRAG